MHMCISVIVTCSVHMFVSGFYFFILHAQVVVPVKKKKKDGARMA